MKISILMINYNGQDTIAKAVESALGQTYDDIEVICVDDCSTDNSIEILKTYESNSKFHLVRHEKNSGMTCGRISGITAATGDYCIFLDSDDVLKPHCCATLAKALALHNCDIIGYGVDVEFMTLASAEAKKSMEDFLVQHVGNLDHEGILEAVYEEGTIKYPLWNKCYRKELVKKAITYLKKDYINLCEDYYFTFITSRLAQTYYGIKDKLLDYYVGAGISTTVHALSPKSIERNMESAYLTHKNCREFIKENNIKDDYCSHADKHERELIFSFILKMKLLAADEEREELTKKIINKFGKKQLVSAMAENCWRDMSLAMKSVDIAKAFPTTKKPFKTIGLYYFRLYNGGTENVISKLSYFLSEQGYKVVVITDFEENELDYELAPGTVRVCLDEEYPVKNGDMYHERFDKLTKCIEDHGIDAVIYNAASSDFGAWDMAAVKSTGAAFIVYIHSIFVAALIDGWPGLIEKQEAYKYADGIVTLTKADRLFWSRANKCTYLVDNPLPETGSSEEKNERNPRKIIWVGRIDDMNKNPTDALHIMYRVVQQMPDAELHMCGIMNEPTKRLMYRTAKTLRISKNIKYLGYITDMSEHYKDAAAVLMTSNFEGFSLVVAEAMAYGAPIVLYELPYMTMTKQSKAVFNVPHRDFDAAANGLVRLMYDGELRETMSKNAVQEAEYYKNIDFGTVWKNILLSVQEGKVELEDKIDIADVYELCAAANLSFSQTNRKIAAYNSELCAASGAYVAVDAARNDYEGLSARIRDIYNSKTFKVGQIIMFIPMKIKGFFWLLKYKGFGYTMKRLFGKSVELDEEDMYDDDLYDDDLYDEDID